MSETTTKNKFSEKDILEYKENYIRWILTANLFQFEIDKLQGCNFYRRGLKQKCNLFMQELEPILTNDLKLFFGQNEHEYITRLDRKEAILKMIFGLTQEEEIKLMDAISKLTANGEL